MAVDQLAVRDRGHVRVSEGHLLLLQGVVEEGAEPAPVSALEL